MTRREARQQAFELIFERSFHDGGVEDIIRVAGVARDVEISDYAKETAAGVFARLEELDGCIAPYCRARSLNRLSRVVRAVLRLAVYEILYVNDLEPRISINEAIELTKKFSGKDEAGFVNGVLGGFMKAYEAGDIKPQPLNDAPAASDGSGEQ